MYRREIGDWLVRTGAVEGGGIETRVTHRGRLVRRRVSATAPEAIETQKHEVELVERMAIGEGTVAA